MDKLIILLMAFLLFIVIFAVLLYVSIKHRFIEKNISEDYNIDDDFVDDGDKNDEELDFGLIEKNDKKYADDDLEDYPKEKNE